jgi:hypothetical protein
MRICADNIPSHPQPYALTACQTDASCGVNTPCVSLFKSADPLSDLLWLPDGVNESTPSSDTCASGSSFVSDIQSAIRTAAGLAAAPAGQLQGSGICMPDLLKVVKTVNQTWFNAQLNNSIAGQASVNGLLPYEKLVGEQGHPCGDVAMTELSGTAFTLVVTVLVSGPSSAGFGATQRGQLANAVAKV